MIEIRHLRAFVTLAEELHFRRAAERLHLSQPPLTAAIQSLEEDLGLRLFDRTKRHVQLTVHGAMLLERARVLVTLTDQFREYGKNAGRGLAGVVRFGMSVSAPFTDAVSRALVEFRRNVPEVAFQTPYVVSPAAGVDALINDTIDVCTLRLDISSYPKLPPLLRHFVVQRDQVMLVLPADHALAARQRIPLALVETENLVLHRPIQGGGLQSGTSNHHHVVRELFRRAKLGVPLIHEVPEITSVLALVGSRFGMSILPSSMQALRSPSIVWREIELSGALLESEVVLAFRSDAEQKNRAAHRFIQAVKRFAAT